MKNSPVMSWFRKPARDEAEDLELARCEWRETFGARAVGERPDELLDQPTGQGLPTARVKVASLPRAQHAVKGHYPHLACPHAVPFFRQDRFPKPGLELPPSEMIASGLAKRSAADGVEEWRERAEQAEGDQNGARRRDARERRVGVAPRDREPAPGGEEGDGRGGGQARQ